MTTPDENGQLPLHRALCDNATLGSIKLLVKGNPSAVSNLDRSFALPLHVACQYHDSTAVVQYLIGLVEVALIAMDREGNSPLHYACRGAKHNTIALLLETYGAVSVSKRNARNKLPIYLLLESDGVSDRESIEYTDSIYRLIRAYPETLMEWNFN
jgi:ankyrin repeat protein